MTTILARITELERTIVEIARAHPHAPRLAAMEYAITDIANAASAPHLRKLFEGDVPPAPAPRVVYVDRPVEVERVVEVEKPVIIERIVYRDKGRVYRPATEHAGRSAVVVEEYLRTNPGTTPVCASSLRRYAYFPS